MALHTAAAGVIAQVLAKKASVKSCVYDSDWRSKTVLTAVVTETLKYKDALEEVIESSGIREKESKIFSKIDPPFLLHVLFYELLVGRKKSLSGKTVFEKTLLKHKTSLAAEWARLKIKRKAKCDAEMATADVVHSRIDDGVVTDDSRGVSIRLPRYVRVNTLKTTVDDVIRHYVGKGFVLIETPSTKEAFHARLSQLEPKSFLRDFHMPEFLLVFPHGTSFHDCPLYKDGTVILQDKASCLPPFVLRPTPGSIVIDACAAPGNKTTLTAALIKNRGRVVAFDINPKRAKLMEKMTSKAGALRSVNVGCVEIRNADFLATKPEVDPFLKDAEFIIVDPSCSGSGIQTRLNHLTDDDTSASPYRLQQLQDFQLRALTHALSFPRVRRVAYSTCSLHEEENEIVVIKALETSRTEGWGFRLIDALPKDAWTTRGNVGGAPANDAEKDAFRLDHCLRSSPATDLTIGFFVALFERTVDDIPDVDSTEERIEDEPETKPFATATARDRKKWKKKEAKRRKKMMLESGVV